MSMFVPAAIRLKELTGKPLVLHVHSLETDRIGEFHDFSNNAVFELERMGMEQADRVVPVSEYTKKCAIKNYGIDPAKLMPVYNAINPAETFRIEKPNDEKLVVFLGRITYQKGPEFMIESATKLLSKYKKVKFAVAGTGDKLDHLKAMVAQRGLKDKFVFTGFLPTPSVKQLLAQADVYFMPSVSEPFGLSALEAAQFDVPVIVSTQSGVSEVLPNTLQADFWDTDKFANFLFALLNYEGLRKDLIENTKKDISILTWDESAQNVLEVYAQLQN
jgi:glycosyltransferase involved in cell wall biosynthesis